MITKQRTHSITLLRAVMLATMTLSGLGVATALKVPFQNFSKSCFSSSRWRLAAAPPCDPREGGGPQGASWSEHGGCICGCFLWVSLSLFLSLLQAPEIRLQSLAALCSLMERQRSPCTGCCSGAVQVLNQSVQRVLCSVCCAASSPLSSSSRSMCQRVCLLLALERQRGERDKS